MAGGHLEVLFREGNLRAWLKLGADFLIAWKPYHYNTSIYVNVGALIRSTSIYSSRA